jgi:hypothetical protein
MAIRTILGVSPTVQRFLSAHTAPIDPKRSSARLQNLSRYCGFLQRNPEQKGVEGLAWDENEYRVPDFPALAVTLKGLVRVGGK